MDSSQNRVRTNAMIFRHKGGRLESMYLHQTARLKPTPNRNRAEIKSSKFSKPAAEDQDRKKKIYMRLSPNLKME